MAASLPHPQRKCFVCHTEIVRTNYALLSIANKDITESKRNKIIIIEKFLSVSVKRDQTNYLCKSCARIVDNIENNVSKLQAIYHSDTTQQENVANTPRKGQGKGRVEKRMAAFSPSSSAGSSSKCQSQTSGGTRPKKRTALSFQQPTSTPTAASSTSPLSAIPVSAEVSFTT